MDSEKYCIEAKRTLAELETKELNNLHMILGMATEVGELLDTFKKDIAYKLPLDWINIEEEIGDILWYIANFCNINNFSLSKIFDKNIEKLKIRYPEKFTELNALERNLILERHTLEK